MEFLSLSRRRSSARSVLIGEERGETDVSAVSLVFNEMPAPDSYMCVVLLLLLLLLLFFYREYHDFLICFDSRTVG